MLDLALAAKGICPAVTKPVFYACLVVCALCLPASEYKRYLNLKEQHYAPSARPSHESGKCHVCGYDLTGNVSGICPECGTAFVRDWPEPPDIRDELRKHRSGDIPGMVLFSLLTLAGILMLVFGGESINLLGVAIASTSAGGILMCVIDWAWMRRR